MKRSRFQKEKKKVSDDPTRYWGNKGEIPCSRLFDLVRHQRFELFQAQLITEAEYALLAFEHSAVSRLETYDAMRQRIAVLEAFVLEARGQIEALLREDGCATS